MLRQHQYCEISRRQLTECALVIFLVSQVPSPETIHATYQQKNTGNNDVNFLSTKKSHSSLVFLAINPCRE